ncbi:MAG: phage major capsid protein [Endomicrobium sp.]|jgi:hypothetical protein|nr:phage major capsid protein [Endomicrobium sp.]
MPGYSYGATLYEDMWRGTRSKFTKEIINMLGRSNPLLSKIAGNDNIRGKVGNSGKRVVETIVARAIDNVQWVGFDGLISPSSQNILEQIEWDWKFCIQSFTVLDMVLSVNRSDELVDLLYEMQEAAKAGLRKDFNIQLYSAGIIPPPAGSTAGAKVDPHKMGGLQYLLSENPYKAGLVVLGLPRGGKPGDDYEFWRNRSGQWYSDTWPANDLAKGKALLDTMSKMLDVLHQDGNEIDGIYTNHYFYDLLNAYREEKVVINNISGEKRDYGFTYLSVKGIPVYLDPSCPKNKMFFINSKEIKLNYLEGENVRMHIKEAPTQFAKSYITTFIGNFTCSKPRFQGMLTLRPEAKAAVPVDMLLPKDCNICDFANFVDYDYTVIESQQIGDDGVEMKGYSGSGVPHAPTEPQPAPTPKEPQPVDPTSK